MECNIYLRNVTDLSSDVKTPYERTLDFVECYTYLRNIQDLLSDVKIPFETRFGRPFKGPIIPFGALVVYYLFFAKDQSRIHLSWSVLWIRSVRGLIWKDDTLFAFLEELETMDASEIYCKRTHCKGSDISRKNLKVHFSSRRWTNQTSWRRSGTQNIRLDTGTSSSRRESLRIFRGESEGSLQPLHDSFLDACEAINDFWSMSGNFIYRHHVEPRVKLFLAERIPLKYKYVSITTPTNFDIKQEKRIDDYWNIDGPRDLSDSWTGFTRFILLKQKPPSGYMWSASRLTRKQLTSRPDHSWPELWTKLGRNAQLERSKSGLMKKPKLDNVRNLRGFF